MAATSQTEKFYDYEGFVEKFKPKKTADDCYTPDNIYRVVLDWASKEYGFDPEKAVRPFYPGGDYQSMEYPEGCVVVDNPPFSILTQIIKWYTAKGIPFVLFAPTLTCPVRWATGIICSTSIVYANGASVNTSFVTNLEPDTLMRTAPELNARLTLENDRNLAEVRKRVPKFEYPPELVTPALFQRLARGDVPFTITRARARHITNLDTARAAGGSVFGTAYLIDHGTAALKVEAERESARNVDARTRAMVAEQRENALVWGLSDRERAIIDAL